MSQLPYVLAPILICSALLKSAVETLSEIRAGQSGVSGTKSSLKQIFAPVGRSYVESGWLWRAELMVAGAVILFCPYEGPLRAVSQLMMAGLFGAFAVVCFLDMFNQEDKPCRCFGNLSKKPPRTFMCWRNVLLCALCLVGLFSAPSSISIVGLFLAVIVLGAILFEEIR